MAVIRTVRFTVDPADAETMLAQGTQLLDAVRAAFAGPTEARHGAACCAAFKMRTTAAL